MLRNITDLSKFLKIFKAKIDFKVLLFPWITVSWEAGRKLIM